MGVVGYSRVSTTDQLDGVSLSAQAEKIKAYCLLHGLDLLQIYTDEGISAKTTTHRPAALQVIELIRKRKVEGVVILKLDRLVRSTKDAIVIAELCKAKNVALHSIYERIDTKSAVGGFFFTLMAALAELERKQVGERTAIALQYKRANGEKTGGDVPYGYDMKVKGRGIHAVKRLVLNPTEQGVITLIQRFRAKGKSLRGIAQELHRRKIKTKTGRTVWHPQVVKSIIGV